MNRHAFISNRVVTPEGVLPAAVIVERGRIRDVVPRDAALADTEVHDFGASVILPGLVDSHVHINEPGRTEWEGFETATRAAAAGGYTTLVDMPLNCLPGTTNVAALEAKRAAARGKCWVDWGAWGGVVGDNQDDIEPLARAGVLGFKSFLIDPGIEGFTMVTEEELRAALPHVARAGLPLLVHAELAGPVEDAAVNLGGANWKTYSTYLQSRPDEAELAAIRLLISLCREFRFRLHIVHLATAEALPLLSAAKNEGLPISVETCPHYLYGAAESVPDGGTLWKCAPPIRSRENRERLWEGLREGIIDLVATDHSPCPPEMKLLDEGDFQRAWGGIASLPVALSVMWAEASNRGFKLDDIARWMSERPASLSGCSARKGQIAAGCDADLVIFDPEAQFVVKSERLYQHHPISPYLGETLHGAVLATYLRGERVFFEGQFAARREGAEIRSGRLST